MSDGMLSQDEIDALLKLGADEDTGQPDNHSNAESDLNDYLSGTEIDTLGEIGNISFGGSATTLSTLLNQKVEITTPTVSIIHKDHIEEEIPFDHISIRVNYIEGFTGTNILIIKKEDAAIIADIMLGGNGQGPFGELNEIHLSAIQEAMNQMMGTAATSMSTVFNKRVDISPPSISESNITEKADYKSGDICVKVSFQLKVGDVIDSSIMQLIPIDFAKQLVHDLQSHKQEATATSELIERSPNPSFEENRNNSMVGSFANEESRNNHQPNPEKESKLIGNQTVYQPNNVQQAEFSNFESQEQIISQSRNLDMLLDIPLKVTVELGRTKRTVKDILQLTSGSIIELDKLAGEPVDILVNEKLIAQGEVVVIDENFGVRVSNIISQSDRLMKLK